MDEAAENIASRGQSELIECRLFVAVNLEHLVEPRDPEDLEKVRVNTAELQLAFDGARFPLEVDQLAERGAREVLNVAEIEQQIPVTFVLNQAIELVANLLDVFFGDNLRFDETDNGHSVNVFEAEMTARTLRHRGYTPDENGDHTEWEQFTTLGASPARGPL
jgi:hypothetical protein